MEPVRSLPPNPLSGECEKYQKWHCEETTDITVNGSNKILSPITYTNQEM